MLLLCGTRHPHCSGQWTIFHFFEEGRRKIKNAFSLFEITHISTHAHTNLRKWTWHFQRPYLTVSLWKHSQWPVVSRKKQLSHGLVTEGSRIRRWPVCAIDLQRELWELNFLIWTVPLGKVALANWPVASRTWLFTFCLHFPSPLVETVGTSKSELIILTREGKRMIWKVKLWMSVSRRKPWECLIRFLHWWYISDSFHYLRAHRCGLLPCSHLLPYCSNIVLLPWFPYALIFNNQGQISSCPLKMCKQLWIPTAINVKTAVLLLLKN